MKKIIALLLALTLVLTMVGCGGKKEYLAGTVSDTGVVAIGVPGQPANTDPALYDGSLAARAVLGMLYQGLTAVDENGQAVGAAAERGRSPPPMMPPSARCIPLPCGRVPAGVMALL